MVEINGLKLHGNFNNITGQKFGKLTAIKPISQHGRHRGIIWLWKCDCGKEIERVSHDIKSGHTYSCGCIRGIETGKSSFNLLYNTYKDSARKRNLSFELSKEIFQYITKQSCYYCGQKPSNIRTGEHLKGEYVYNGIDRLDSKKGYVIGNVVSCCGMCNKMKLDFGFSDFMSKIKSIYIRHSSTISLIESEV